MSDARVILIVHTLPTFTGEPESGPDRRRILLVYPEIPDTYWSYRHALRFVGRKALMPPLGLMTVAAILGNEFDYRLVDMNVGPLTDDAIAWADYVFLSAMIVQAESMQQVIARCNRARKPVVAGGPYPTSCSEEIRGVNHFVLGEGECTIPALRRDLIAGRLQPLYQAPGRPELDTTPAPRFDLCDIAAYDTMPLQFSRGCPFDCEFCDIVSLFGHRVRTKSAAQFVAEMQSVFDTGFRGNVFVVDDNFIGNRGRVKQLLRAIAAWQVAHGVPFTLSTEASVDLADDAELLELMATAGFSMAFVGLETPVGGALAEAGKRQNLRGDLVAKVRRIQRAGIEVTAGFIIGFDADPPDIAARQIAFIQEVGVPTAMVGLLTALPNTRLSQRLTREGRMRTRSDGNNTHGDRLNFVPRMPERTLIAAYRHVLSTIYHPRRYFQRALTLIRRMPRRSAVRAPEARLQLSRANLRALALSLARQGFSGYAAWYWLFLLRAVAIRPRLFVRIVAIAVRGHHFFTITGAMPAQRSGARARSAVRTTGGIHDAGARGRIEMNLER